MKFLRLVFHKLLIQPFVKGERGHIYAILAIVVVIVIAVIQLLPKSSNVTIKYDKRNSIIGKVCSKRANKDGKSAVLFYNLKIIGIGERSTSIDNIRFFSKIDNTWVEGDRITVHVTDTVNGKFMDCLGVEVQDDRTGAIESICLGHWVDIVKSYNKKLDYADTEMGCAIFSFDLPLANVGSAKEMKFAITDNFGKVFTVGFVNDLLYPPREGKKRTYCVMDYPPGGR